MTYSWTTPEETMITKDNGDGSNTTFPANPANRHYIEFLASGETAAPYVEPAPLPAPTPAEKLAAVGLTIDELRDLLA